MDRFDNIVVGILKKENEMNFIDLWLRAYTKESKSSFRKRLDNLQEKNIIIINKDMKRRVNIIKLRDKPKPL